MMEQDVRKKLNISIVSPYWEEAYEKIQQNPGVPEWLMGVYYRRLHEEYQIFPENLELFVNAVEQIAQNEDLCMLAKIIYEIIGLRTSSGEAFKEFEIPVAPEGTTETLAYDLVALFPVLAHIRPSWKELEKRGVEADVLRVRFSMLDSWISGSVKTEGRPYFSKGSFLVYRAFVYVSELRLGRLRFQWVEHSNFFAKVFVNDKGDIRIMMDGITMHKSGHVLGTYGFTEEEGSFYAKVTEDEENYEGYAVEEETHLAQTVRTKLSKKEWKLCLAPGDAALKVHIAGGPGFGPAECEEAFAMARELFPRCFPEYDFKGFVTHTWFLGPALEPALREGSNIKNFRNYFEIFPAKSNGNDVFQYVYRQNVKTPAEVAIDELPEDNSLRKGIKEQLQKGNYIYEFNGFMRF